MTTTSETPPPSTRRNWLATLNKVSAAVVALHGLIAVTGMRTVSVMAGPVGTYSPRLVYDATVDDGYAYVALGFSGLPYLILSINVLLLLLRGIQGWEVDATDLWALGVQALVCAAFSLASPGIVALLVMME